MENLSRGVSAKFDLAAQLVERVEGPDGREHLLVELEAIRTRYALCTSHLIIQAASGETARTAAREEFQRIVASEDFLGELDHLVGRMRVALAVEARPTAAAAKSKARTAPLTREARETRAILDQYEGYSVDCAAKTVELSLATHGSVYNVCAECKTEMLITADTSELTCTECGKVRELVGTVFDDAQFYNQEGQKAKSGSFNPNRHYRYWMDRIMAREPEEELGDKDDPENTCGEKLFAAMRGIIRRDRKILRLLTVDDVRAMLKELDQTTLNKNVPLIMRRLTGVGPPSLPESISQRTEKLFSKAIEIGEEKRPEGRTNRNYYPYYIYKILDAILPEDVGPDGKTIAEAREMRRVLYYIYMQGQDTLAKNDREWKEICEDLEEIKWVPTNRAKAQRYRPL